MTRFVWYDILSNDHDAAVQFYEKVFSWVGVDSGLEDRRFTVFTIDEAMIGGVRDLSNVLSAPTVRPSWIGYIAVSSVDLYASNVEKAGGKILRAPEDIPHVGRFSVVADPQGAVFGLFHNPQVLAMAPPQSETEQVGRVIRQELRSSNQERASLFYAETFGWQSGIDSLLSAQTKARWIYGFRVESLEETAALVREYGGSLIDAPYLLAGGEEVQTCADPEGAVFALIVRGVTIVS